MDEDEVVARIMDLAAEKAKEVAEQQAKDKEEAEAARAAASRTPRPDLWRASRRSRRRLRGGGDLSAGPAARRSRAARADRSDGEAKDDTDEGRRRIGGEPSEEDEARAADILGGN